MTVLLRLLLALLGLCIGSFLNVLIYRLPHGEDWVKTPSHCPDCGCRLRWYELLPVLSFFVQRGRCRACGGRISAQYPLVELGTAALYLAVSFCVPDDPWRCILCCALVSVLLALSVIDWRTFEIPNGLNLTVFLLGLLRLFTDFENCPRYLVGFFCVSGPFFLLWLCSGGRWIGLGDAKLMAGAGLFLGWQAVLLALLLGSALGTVVHLVRMRCGASPRLAYGPYLSVGIFVSALFGERLIAAYCALLYID
ncbi:MAG: prepilin peptidase [Oscillospiraceae bacterium]|nr:prepilin peptidase [Oscillospiraceae bacterium]